jgi:hypothetical protein
LFELILLDFTRSVGAGNDKRIVQLDNAGWDGSENLTVPDGIRLVLQPAHSPELQPAEHLWRFVDEPLANRCFDTIESLDHAVGQRCLALTHQCDIIRDSIPLVAAPVTKDGISRSQYHTGGGSRAIPQSSSSIAGAMGIMPGSCRQADLVFSHRGRSVFKSGPTGPSYCRLRTLP